jgi:hypothetical protein
LCILRGSLSLAPQDEGGGVWHERREVDLPTSMPVSTDLILRCEAKPSLEGRTTDMQPLEPPP